MNIREIFTGIFPFISKEEDENEVSLGLLNSYTCRKLLLLLNQLLECIPTKKLEEKDVASLCQFLNDHWKIVADTNAEYTIAAKLQTTIACLVLAQYLEPIVKKSRYQLLMPTITVTNNEASMTELKDNSLELHQFVVSKDRIIGVKAALDSSIEDGKLKHDSLFDGKVQPLSPLEAEKVIKHSKATKEYYDAIMKKVEIETKGESFGAVITRLVNQLEKGGASGGHGGKEYNAAKDANVGILHFSNWLNSLDKNDREKLLKLTAPGLTVSVPNHPDRAATFADIWDRLARPADVNYKNTIYCVELIAGNLKQILKYNQFIFNTFPQESKQCKSVSIEQAQLLVDEKDEALKKALAGVNYNVTSRYQNGDIILLKNLLTRSDLQRYIDSECIESIFCNNIIQIIQILESNEYENFINSLPENLVDIIICKLKKILSVVEVNSKSYFLECVIKRYVTYSNIHLDRDQELIKQILKAKTHFENKYIFKLIDNYFGEPTHYISNFKTLCIIFKTIELNEYESAFDYFGDRFLDAIKQGNRLVEFIKDVGHCEEKVFLAVVKKYPFLIKSGKQMAACLNEILIGDLFGDISNNLSKYFKETQTRILNDNQLAVCCFLLNDTFGKRKILKSFFANIVENKVQFILTLMTLQSISHSVKNKESVDLDLIKDRNVKITIDINNFFKEMNLEGFLNKEEMKDLLNHPKLKKESPKVLIPIKLFDKKVQLQNDSAWCSTGLSAVELPSGHLATSHYLPCGHIRIIDLQTGKIIRKFSQNGQRGDSIAVLKNGNIIVGSAMARDEDFRVYDPNTGKLLQQFSQNNDGVSFIQVLSNGHIVTAGYGSKEIRIYDPDQGKLINKIPVVIEGSIVSVKLMSDDLVLISTNSVDREANSCFIMNFRTSEIINKFCSDQTLHRHQIDLLPNGNIIFWSWLYKSVFIYDVKTCEITAQYKLDKVTDGVIATTQDGNIAIAGYGNQIRILSPTTGQCIKEYRIDAIEEVGAIQSQTVLKLLANQLQLQEISDLTQTMSLR